MNENPFKKARDSKGISIHKEEMDIIINRTAYYQLDLIISELKKFAKYIKVRYDDFDLGNILANKTNFSERSN